MGKANGATITNYDAELKRVAELLRNIYTPMEVHDWLLSKNKLLDDNTPAQLIAKGRVAEVEALIDQLNSGAFT